MVGLSTLLLRGINDSVIFDRIFQIFNVLISFLKFSEYMEQATARGDYDEKDKESIPTRDVLLGFLSTQDDNTFNKQPIDVNNVTEQEGDFHEEGDQNQATNQEQEQEDDNDYQGFTEDPDEVILFF